jgi:threonine/homoserine/homoserine lactone efflux protein
VAAWAAFGSALRRVLQRPRVRRAFNITMALLLVASLVPIVQA